MISVSSAANAVFLCTHMILCFVLFRDGKIISLAMFATIFMAGLLVRRKAYFWKSCAAYFCLLGILYAAHFFGGFEPIDQPAFSNFLGVESLLLFMVLLSAFLSFVVEFRAQKRTRHG